MEQQIKSRIYFLLEEERACLECVEKEVTVWRSRVLNLESVMAEPEFVECMQWHDKLPPLPSWPSRRKGKKRARTDSNDVPVP